MYGIEEKKCIFTDEYECHKGSCFDCWIRREMQENNKDNKPIADKVDTQLQFDFLDNTWGKA